MKLQIPITNRKSQEGVTLLLGILILAGITLITITVGFFAIQEIRSSRAVLLSEPAITAAETAGEIGIWNIKRSGTLNTCQSTPNQLSLNNESKTDYCKSFDIANFDLTTTEPAEFFLYNPDDINGDIAMDNFSIDNIRVTLLSYNGQVPRINVETLDGITVINNQLISTTSASNFSIPADIAGSTDERLFVTITTSGHASVQVTTNRGMPDYPTIDASGCASKSFLASCSAATSEAFKRRVNITVPQ